MLTRLKEQDFTHRREPMAFAKDDPACKYLKSSLVATDHVDRELSLAIGELAPFLHWKRIGEHVSRPPQGIMNDYTFSQIIGPDGVYPGDDFMMGLFIIGPEQYYPEHLHAAPEFYWLFSGPTEWRFSTDGTWTQKEAGELQWIKPFITHGIRTLDVPLFSLWAWTNDIDGDYEFLGGKGKSQFNERPVLS